MSKRIVLVVVLVLGISFASFAGVFDTFLANYGAGRIHTLFFTDPVKFIELLGEEPTSYDYYSSGQHIFTYVELGTSSKLNTLAIIWENGSIEEIRVGFAEGTSVESALKILGYTQGFFSSQETIDQRFGDVPYHAQQFIAKDAINEEITSTYSSPRNVLFIFLLSHFTNSVHILVIQHG